MKKYVLLVLFPLFLINCESPADSVLPAPGRSSPAQLRTTR